MGKDVSFAVVVKDGVSPGVATMRNAFKSLNKDLDETQKKIDALNNKKAVMKTDLKPLQKELQEAQKQFVKTGQEADRLKAVDAQIKFDNAKSELQDLSKQAIQAKKDLNTLQTEGGKLKNAIGGESGVLGSLAKAGATKMIGDALSQSAGALVNSAYGSEIGTMFSSVLSGAAAGAALGSIIPGIGTAVGAAVGGAAGVIQGATSVFESKDDAFQGYYEGQYNDITTEQANTLTRGIDTASKRQVINKQYSTMLRDPATAESFLADLKQFAIDTPFDYEGLAQTGKTLLAAGAKKEDIIPDLKKLGDAGSAIGFDPNDVAVQLARMRTSGKAKLLFINPLITAGVKVWDYLAEAYFGEVTEANREKVQDMVSDGKIKGSEVADIITNFLGDEFEGGMDNYNETYEGKKQMVEERQSVIDSAMGDGFIDEREKGLDAWLAWADDGGGDRMQDANYKIGQWKAFLENEKERFQRESVDSVMSGVISGSFSEENQAKLKQISDEYAQLEQDGSKETGAKAGALLAEAKAIAQNEYNASEGATLEKESQLSLADSLKNDAGLNEAYWDFGYQMGQQFSEGLISAQRENGVPGASGGVHVEGSGAVSRHTNAYGLSYVPYNNYPAVLHEGERVLTAAENRRYGKGSAAPIISGNNFYIREEADIDKVATVLAQKMERAYALNG